MSLRGALVIGICLATLMPAASAVGQEAMKVSASARAACMPDAVRYCRELVPAEAETFAVSRQSEAPMCCQGAFGGAGRPVMGHALRASSYEAMRCRGGCSE